MNNFEPKSKEEVQQFFDGLRSKSMDEIISLYGLHGNWASGIVSTFIGMARLRWWSMVEF